MRITFLVALITFVADQILKWVVVVGLNLREILMIEVWPPYFTLSMAWNQGVNFGLFADESPLLRWVLILLPVVVTIWVWRWVRREGGRPLMQASAGLLIGGALGNAIDRLVWGAVADFLNVSCCGFINPWAFNIADIAIFVGAFGLILTAGGKTPRDDRASMG